MVNVDGETGLVVAPGDPVALRGAMQRLWDEDALAATLGANARMRFERLFTADRMGDGYVNLYRKLVNGDDASATAD